MLKNFSKFLLIMLAMFLISSSSLICFADEEHNHEHTDSTTTTGTNEETSTTDETTTEEPEIHTGDLYLFDNNIVMDKYVDGNVFLFGNNVEITGTVNGNLFVFANKVNFNKSIVRYSIFACANSVYYNGGCGSYSDYGILYVAANNFEATYDSYVTGDIKAVASNTILKAAIYRDVDLISNNINLGEGTDIPNVYGAFRYTSNREITIPEGIMLGNGSVNYTSTYETSSIIDIIIAFAVGIVTTLVIYVITSKICPKLIDKISTKEFSFVKLLKAFVIGIVSIILFVIIFILLLISTVGASLAFILALLFAILCIIATPVLTIRITNILKPVLKIEKTSMFYLVLALVSIILYGITYIPFVGSLISFIITITSIGLIINTFLPHKELTEEEKLALEEAKKIKLENKEKRKQEKLEAKATKKQEKQNKENE